METIDDKVISVWEIERDRSIRAKNVMLANIPESVAAEGRQRKMMKRLFQTCLIIY